MPATTNLNYPHDFRTVPQFLIDVPEDWQVIEYPGALYAVASVDPDQPWLNVIVRHERIVAGSHERLVADRGSELAAKHTGHNYELEEEMGYEVADDLFLARQTSWDDPELGTRVRQLEMSTAAPNTLGSPLNDIVDLVFLHPIDAADLYAEQILQILQSFRFA